MKFGISSNIEKVHFPPISEVKGWVAGRAFPAQRPLVDLCQAIPDYPPAAELVEHLKGVLDDPATSKYSPDEGLPEVREAVCAWYARHYGAAPRPGQLCLTIGASQAFWLAMAVLCRQGDEVILQAPCYFDHAMGLQTLGIRPVFAPFDEARGGLPDPGVLAGLISERTRAILLVTPSNPSGAVIPPATVRALFELARSRGLALVLDETYNAFVDGPPHELFADRDWDEHFVQLASFGKTFALTGYRAGALIASELFIHHALKAQDSMAVCQPRVTQHAVRFGCEHLDGWVAANRAMMQRRHDRFRAEFNVPGNPFRLAASGGFFAWVRHPFDGQSGRQVARRLAEQANLICLPGEVFGPGLENYLRLAFGNIREEQIPEAVARFREFAY
ncbi:aminotransferase [Desulfuromonas versatilis]|uniref:Aminotransferase n=1 Tax=Desulfuromonas versatilis TaxID=2802975 RepID=A0ABM8HVB3_9BACT|nr:aminotransferase [Desulfuromonas versatilis]BCR05853.1 aminotransferase [Desulfuromonas versatilis]